ncbi:MAG: hypothetical protein QM736_15545 [Vicinamibacterales bacterium]
MSDLDDFERLLAVVGLRDEQVVDVDTELPGVHRVERMLGVDERRHAAEPLRLGDHLQRQRGLARRFRSEDLDDAATRHAADTERVVDADRAGRDGVDRPDGALLPEAHDRALARTASRFWPTASSTAFRRSLSCRSSRSFFTAGGMLLLIFLASRRWEALLVRRPGRGFLDSNPDARGSSVNEAEPF